MPKQRLGLPADWAAVATDRDAALLAEQFAQLDARVGALDREAKAFVVESRRPHRRDEKVRLLAQGRSIEARFRALTVEHDRLQRLATAAEKRLVMGTND